MTCCCGKEGTFVSSNKRPQRGTGNRGTVSRSTYDLTFRVDGNCPKGWW